MIWKVLVLLTNCSTPFYLIDSSGGISFSRGDLVFLTNYNEPIRVGQTIAFRVKDRPVLILHRVVRIHEREDGEIQIRTKGDGNVVDDLGLYPQGQFWLTPSEIRGRVVGVVRYLNFLLLLQGYSFISYLFLGMIISFIQDLIPVS